ncbi:MAG: UPF0262 family protein [Myxococcota bacterium]
MKFRIDEALWDGRRPDREREWQHALMDLNAEHDGHPPVVTIARRDDGGADLKVVHGGDAPTVEQVVALTFDMLRDHFRDYREVIGRLARADAGALGMRDWETLDYAKKLVHDEAGGRIRRALKAVLPIELKLARRIFTLVFLVAADIPAELVMRHRSHGPNPS